MKNFPHQINQLSRLNQALGVFEQLIEGGQNVDDDGVLGDALARAEVYTFRTPGNRTIDQLLQLEHRKSKASQGTRTCARELRRFFNLLGFIRHTNELWEIAPSSKSLLALRAENQRAAANDIWRQALLAMELTDAGNSSHPYQILLRLVIAVPGLPKPYSGLCLEAQTDSNAEFDRIQEIASRPNPSGTMDGLAGSNMAKNSIKILPSIAEQLGDIQDRNGRLFISDRVTDALGTDDEPGVSDSEQAVQRLVRRPYVPRRREGSGQRREQGVAQPAMRFYDPDLVGVRFNAHEDCLDRLSELFPPGVEKLQATYDLLLVIPETAMLVEAKTIRNDARRQVRAALGQLFYYEYFDVVPLQAEREILKLTLTDHELPEELQNFLAKHQIGAVWILGNGRIGGTELGLANMRKLGVRL